MTAISTTTSRKIPVGTIVLLTLVALGFLAAMARYLGGFAIMSNLGDGRPWGFWIAFDLLCGVALSAGAFLTAGMVYILHLEKYRPVLRPALLTGFLGYILVITALLVDLGIPYRIWHMIIYWNPHSPMFEVGMCVMAYTAVLALEFSPLVFQRLNMQGPLKVIRAITIPVVIAGIVLSTMHQSSLGSLFLMMPFRLHPLWYSPILPVIFLISAIAAGLGMVMFECTLTNYIFGRGLHLDILRGLGRALLVVLILLFVVKMADLAVAGELGLMFEGSVQSKMYLLENFVGIILPVALLLVPRFRQDAGWLFRIGLLAVIGLMLHRLNVGMNSMAGTPYVPTVAEFLVSAGIVSFGVLLFGLAVRFLPICQDTGGGECEGPICEALTGQPAE